MTDGVSTTPVESYDLAPDYRIPRLLKGGWQLAGGHGAVDRRQSITDMFAFVEHGLTAFDCADIYTGVEDLIGEFLDEYRRRFGVADEGRLKIHTKFVPDWDELASIDKVYVERIIDRSLTRLRVDRLDMVQFAWWAYEAERDVQTAHWLTELQRAGKIDRLGLCNYNVPRMERLLDAGFLPVAHQIQYSLLDHRPEKGMTKVCAAHGIHLLSYGTVAGGFLSDRWLGQPEPDGSLENRSLTKYKLIIDDFGGWELFQELLHVLRGLAAKHGASITNVATRYILDCPQVAGVIIGARHTDQLRDNLKVFSLTLDRADRAAIDTVLLQRQGPDGDVFDLERDREGRHGRIMKYNLNLADPAR